MSEGRAELLWTSKELSSHFNSPVYHEGYIYGIGDPGRLVCINTPFHAISSRCTQL